MSSSSESEEYQSSSQSSEAEDFEEQPRGQISVKKSKIEGKENEKDLKKQQVMKRKASKEHGEIILELRQMYASILPKDGPHALTEDEKRKTAHEMLRKCSHFIVDLTTKHDASRVVQMILKYGSDQDKEEVWKQVKGKILKLIQDRYAHFLIQKVIKYLPEHRVHLLHELDRKIVKVCSNKISAGVLEYFFNQFANQSQRESMMMEFYGAEFAVFKNPPKSLEKLLAEQPQSKRKIMDQLKKNLEVIINKGGALLKHSMFHQLLLEYYTHASNEQRFAMTTELRENLVDILHTSCGARVCVWAIAHAQPKDKKIIVKSLTGYATLACLEPMGYVMMLKLLNSVDDTVILNKYILSEMKKHIDQLVNSKGAVYVLLSLVAPHEPKFFPAHLLTHLALKPEAAVTKKPDDQRKAEILSYLGEALTNYCAQNWTSMILHPHASKVLLHFVKRFNPDQLTNFAKSLSLILGQEFAKPFTPESPAQKTLKKSSKNKNTNNNDDNDDNNDDNDSDDDDNDDDKEKDMIESETAMRCLAGLVAQIKNPSLADTVYDQIKRPAEFALHFPTNILVKALLLQNERSFVPKLKKVIQGNIKALEKQDGPTFKKIVKLLKTK